MNSFNLSAPPTEKIVGGFQQAGKKEGSLGRIPPVNPIARKISSDFFKYTLPEEIIGTDTYFFKKKIDKKNISFGKHVKL